MKETDYNVVYAQVQNYIDENGCSLTQLVGNQTCAWLVANIYMMTDVTCGYGQDVRHIVSVISSPKRISLIVPEGMSFYQGKENLISYDDLLEDVQTIVTVIDFVYDRITARY